jgi:multiple sugar transport system substrate-binding protein
MKNQDSTEIVDSKGQEAGIGRRKFLQIGAAGAAATAVGTGAFGAGASSAEAAVGVNKKKFAGSTVKILLVDGERDQNGLQDKLQYIKDTYGITVEVDVLALGAQIGKTQTVLHAKTSTYDIIDNLGFTVSGVVGAGLYTKLNSYIADKSATPANYNFPKDWPAGQLDYISFYDRKNNKFGGKDVYLIPGMHSGSVIMFYRKDLLEAANLSVPKTWDEYLTVAQKLNSGSVSGTSMIGANDVSLILVDWYARFASMGGKLMSGTPGGKNYTPHLDSPIALKALQHMVDCAKVSPNGVSSFGFTETVDAFSRGNVGIMTMWSTIGGSIFNPATSKVASTAATALIPGASATSAGHPIRGGWGLGIPNNLPKKRKDAAWLVMTYITSSEFDKYQFGNYQTDPNRRSTWADLTLSAKYPYIKNAGAAMETASILDVAVVPETFELVGEAAREFNLAISGTQDVATSCANAQASWIKILKRQGYLA